MEILEIYDKVTNKVATNIQKINNILSSSKIDSQLAKDETKEVIEKILNFDQSEIVMKERTSEYYDLKSISAMLKTLDVHNKSVDSHKRKVNRSESVSSLGMYKELWHKFKNITLNFYFIPASDDSNRDFMPELRNQLNEIKNVLESIENDKIELYDEESSVANVMTKNNKFFELVFTLQRLAREMTSIASTDNISSKNSEFPIIDNDFVDQLQQLDKVFKYKFFWI